MTVLVVGATGTVGSEVTRQLRDAGVAVRAASRSPERTAGSFGEGVDVVRFDAERPETWAAALEGVDRLFYLRPPDIAQVGRLTPFLEAAAAAGVGHVVLLSVQGAGSNPLLPHRVLERWIERSPMAWTFLRAAFFMQNLTTVHRAEIRDRREIFVPAGNGRTAFVDVRDIAAVAVAAFTDDGHRGRAYDLTGSEAPTYDEVAATLSEVLGERVSYARPGPLRFVRAQLRRGQPRGFVVLTLVLYTATRLGLADRLTGEVHRLLGRPPTTLRSFAQDHADAWRPDGGG